MIRIQNIYYMLSYAFQILKEKEYSKFAAEEFDNAAELCAAILIKGVSSQIKRGLVKDYILQRNSLSVLRGKIDITGSIKEQTFVQNQMVCYYDEFSVNAYLNRIIKTTMNVLIRSEICRERKKQIRKLLIYFDNVELLDIKKINWNLRFHRNNQTYQMMIFICYLILNGLVQTTEDGKIKLMDFFDEQRMCRLYEKFIFQYYKKEHPELEVASYQIPWATDDGYTDMLPLMQSDIVLTKGRKTLIIDAKYYSHTTQNRFNSNKLISGNLYQIFTYVKNYDKNDLGDVAGMLLYAKTDETILPNNTYKMSGNAITVKTLDLDCDFSVVKKQLDCFRASLNVTLAVIGDE